MRAHEKQRVLPSGEETTSMPQTTDETPDSTAMEMLQEFHVQSADHGRSRSKIHPAPESQFARIEREPGFVKLQRIWRSKTTGPGGIRLNAKNLAARCLFESKLMSGLFSLCVQLGIFLLLLAALLYTGNPPAKRGIYTNLQDSFDFDSLWAIKSHDAFVEALGRLSSSYKKYFLLSPLYFDTSGNGDVQLIGDFQKFTDPIPASGFDLTIRAPTISFTAWIKTRPQFQSGYMIRKRPSSSGAASDLSCWAWLLDAQSGPKFVFGAHDFSPRNASHMKSKFRQDTVGIMNPVEFRPETYYLLTVVVNSTHAVFYQNVDLLGVDVMPRPLTDCLNTEGVLLGDADTEIGQLRFYPRSLSAASIHEIYTFGSTLADISTGAKAFDVGATGLPALRKSLEETVSQVHSAVASRQNEVEIAQIAQLAAEQPAPREDTPSYSGAADVAYVETKGIADNRAYHKIFSGPNHVLKISFTGIPDTTGAGFTLSFWYKHVACNVKTCHVCIVSADEFGSTFENFVCLSERGVYLGAAACSKSGGVPGFFDFQSLGMPDKYYMAVSKDQFWRHIAVQIDETSNKVRFFLDGAQAVESDLCLSTGATSVAQMDGSSRSLTIQGDPRTSTNVLYALAAVADVRLYLHSDDANSDNKGDGPLTAAQIYSISRNQAPASLLKAKCLPYTSPYLQDFRFKDHLGHDCLVSACWDWYFQSKSIKPAVCQHYLPVENCAASCQSKLECFEGIQTEEEKVYFAWDRIRRIEPAHANGSVCLGQGLKKNDIVQECKTWMASKATGTLGGRDISAEHDMALYHWLRITQPKMGKEFLMSAQGPHVNMTECEQLEMAIDEGCEFDLQPVKNFTRDIKTSDGWSIGFWVKSVGFQSLKDGKFYPGLSLLHSISPPEPLFGFGKFVGESGPYPASYMGTYGVDPGRPDATDGPYDRTSIFEEMSTSQWNFIAYSNGYDSAKGTFSMQNSLSVSEDLNAQLSPNIGEAFFKAIEVNTPMYVSPIMMIPKVKTPKQLQEIFLDQVGDMSFRSGPQMTNKVRESTRVAVKKLDYVERSTLVAAPILFQTRGTKTAECPFNYSSVFVQKMHAKALVDKCDPSIYACDALVSNVESISTCTGTGNQSEMYFGLLPSKFLGKTGYADFLASIADNSFVFRQLRNGSAEGAKMWMPTIPDVDIKLTDHVSAVMPTNDFINSATQSAQVVLVFFTPRSGIVTVLDISADFSGSQATVVSVTVDHYGVIEGADLNKYIVVQCTVLIFVGLLLIDSVRTIWNCCRQDDDDWFEIFDSLLDIGIGVLVLWFVVQMLSDKTASAKSVASILEQLEDIPWSSSSVTLETKMGSFFKNVEQLKTLIDRENDSNILGNTILIVNLLRVVQFTSLHPRLAMLTGTVIIALDDLWHTAILTCLLMLSFAGLGTWRFGDRLAQFETFEKSLQIEWEMLIGASIPENWSGDKQLARELQVWTVLYLMIVFLLILNFLLAIIVEAYMKVRAEAEGNEVESEFLRDVYSTCRSRCIGIKRGWPAPAKLGEQVAKWNARISVGYRDLMCTGLFKSPEACMFFLKFYYSFDFMEPPLVGKYGKLSDPELDKSSGPLKVQLMGSIVEVVQRRESEGRVTQADTLRLRLLRGAATASLVEGNGKILGTSDQDRLHQLANQVTSNTQSLKRLQTTQESILQAIDKLTHSKSNASHSKNAQDASDSRDILEDLEDVMKS